MQTFKDQHPIHTDITVAWGDMDALQHVNNVVYLRYFEIAKTPFAINARLLFPILSL